MECWRAGDLSDHTQEELREANNNKISKIGHENIRKRVVMQKWQENFGKEISYMNADEIEIDEELKKRPCGAVCGISGARFGVSG